MRPELQAPRDQRVLRGLERLELLARLVLRELQAPRVVRGQRALELRGQLGVQDRPGLLVRLARQVRLVWEQLGRPEQRV